MIALKRLDRNGRTFVVQLHLTHKCNLSCMHCYIDERDQENTLDSFQIIRIIDDINTTVKSWGASLRVNFTGGDPLLFKGFWQVLEFTNKEGIRIGILGNPELLDTSTCASLESSGVTIFQLSLDGEEDFHDYLRYKGSFKKTLKAIEILNKSKIKSVVMFSVCKQNMDQLINVIHIVVNNNVNRFDFARIVPIGNAKKMDSDSIKPEEYRSLLCQVDNVYKKYRETHSKTFFGRKENLWKLFFLEAGHHYTFSNSIVCGCGIGYNSISVLPNGTVLGCRRLPIEIGDFTKNSFREIFLNSQILNTLRGTENIQKCNMCPLLNYCRGCRAIAYGTSGNYFSLDPQCWRKQEE